MVTVSGQWVEFKFFRPAADEVHVAGDFNAWREGELRMIPSSGGYWTAKLRLPPGVFKFRYNADGQWFTDYAAFGVEPGCFGLDSVVRVTQQPVRPLQPVFAQETSGTAAA